MHENTGNNDKMTHETAGLLSRNCASFAKMRAIDGHSGKKCAEYAISWVEDGAKSAHQFTSPTTIDRARNWFQMTR